MHKSLLVLLFFSFLTVSAASNETVLTVQISEIMVVNTSGLKDEDGDCSDWIELYNPTLTDINLDGWFITDNQLNLTKWRIPAKIIRAGGYLIIFASGKNRSDASKLIHTSFKLNSGGESLLLVTPDGEYVADSYLNFPQQYPDVSYGRYQNNLQYFAIPSPGAANTNDEFLTPPRFSIKHGLYNSPLQMELSTDINNANIIYTTDGSTPTLNNGNTYTSKITINRTTPIRAATQKNNALSNIVTNTYIFPDSVIRQSNTPSGYPAQWGPFIRIAGTAPADYGMDPEIYNNTAYKDSIIPGLRSLSTISIVTNAGYLFSNDTSSTIGGIYDYPGYDGEGLGRDWERPASVEYFNTTGTKDFQVNCGLRIEGGDSRLPEKSPKHSFRLLFKKEYGPANLKFPFFDDKQAETSFNTIILRAGFNNTFHHHASDQRKRAQYVRDSWAKDTQLEMGHPSAHNTYVQLYINGIYWGLYNISERMDMEFASKYFGGEDGDWDVIKDYPGVVDGNLSAWNNMMTLANAGLSTNSAYQAIQGNNPDGTPSSGLPAYLDIVSLIDYMLINIYGANSDWDHHNWAAARNRVNPGTGYKFLCWDEEHILEGINDNVVNENNANCPSRLYTKLRDNIEFRMLFADRVQKHFFNNGALTPDAATRRYLLRANEVRQAIYCETARWGDYRRDVHQYSSGPYYLYTVNDFWLVEQKRLLNDYFPYRSAIVLDQLKAAGLYPALDAPQFSQFGGPVNKGDKVTISAPAGAIYYTIDGTDPRSTGGTTSPKATLYSGNGVSISDTVLLKARVKSGTAWSALTEATFFSSTTQPNGIYKLASEITFNAYPNPFRENVTIQYTVKKASNINISVYSNEGRFIETIFDGNALAGNYTKHWKPEHISGGIYLLIIQNETQRIIQKIIYLP